MGWGGWGVWGVGCGVWGVGCGVWGVGCGLWAVGCVGCGVWGVWVWGVGCVGGVGVVLGVWSVGCGVWGVGCGVWGVGCGVWGVGCGVWGVGCGVWGGGYVWTFQKDGPPQSGVGGIWNENGWRPNVQVSKIHKRKIVCHPKNKMASDGLNRLRREMVELRGRSTAYSRGKMPKNMEDTQKQPYSGWTNPE